MPQSRLCTPKPLSQSAHDSSPTIMHEGCFLDRPMTHLPQLSFRRAAPWTAHDSSCPPMTHSPPQPPHPLVLQEGCSLAAAGLQHYSDQSRLALLLSSPAAAELAGAADSAAVLGKLAPAEAAVLAAAAGLVPVGKPPASACLSLFYRLCSAASVTLQRFAAHSCCTCWSACGGGKSRLRQQQAWPPPCCSPPPLPAGRLSTSHLQPAGRQRAVLTVE